jgi:hypothetical protein
MAAQFSYAMKLSAYIFYASRTFTIYQSLFADRRITSHLHMSCEVVPRKYFKLILDLAQ